MKRPSASDPIVIPGDASERTVKRFIVGGVVLVAILWLAALAVWKVWL